MSSRRCIGDDLNSCLYVGRIMHHRLAPFRHRFVYQTFALLLDLDQLDALDDRLRLLSIERANLLSFHARDHGPLDGSPLRPWIEARLVAHGLEHASSRILLLCLPRILGYVFNPLSIYYCYDGEGRLGAVLYEVRNTLGEQHAYVLPVDRRKKREHLVRQSCTKDFYVSPFIDMAACYQFTLSMPGKRLSVVVREDVAQKPQLVASMSAHRRPLSDRELARAAVRYPLMTHKVTAAIHWQALRLWLKGAAIRPPAGGRSCPVRKAERGPCRR